MVAIFAKKELQDIYCKNISRCKMTATKWSCKNHIFLESLTDQHVQYKKSLPAPTFLKVLPNTSYICCTRQTSAKNYGKNIITPKTLEFFKNYIELPNQITVKRFLLQHDIWDVRIREKVNSSLNCLVLG